MSDPFTQIVEFYEEIDAFIDDLNPGELYALVPIEIRQFIGTTWEDPDCPDALHNLRQYIKGCRIEHVLKSDGYNDWKQGKRN